MVINRKNLTFDLVLPSVQINEEKGKFNFVNAAKAQLYKYLNEIEHTDRSELNFQSAVSKEVEIHSFGCSSRDKRFVRSISGIYLPYTKSSVMETRIYLE